MESIEVFWITGVELAKLIEDLHEAMMHAVMIDHVNDFESRNIVTLDNSIFVEKASNQEMGPPQFFNVWKSRALLCTIRSADQCQIDRVSKTWNVVFLQFDTSTKRVVNSSGVEWEVRFLASFEDITLPALGNGSGEA